MERYPLGVKANNTIFSPGSTEKESVEVPWKVLKIVFVGSTATA